MNQIGVVPPGASWRCRLGWHVPKPGGGLSVFECENCGGCYWQPEEVRNQLRYAEQAMQKGDFEEAERIRVDTLRKAGQQPLVGEDAPPVRRRMLRRG